MKAFRYKKGVVYFTKNTLSDTLDKLNSTSTSINKQDKVFVMPKNSFTRDHFSKLKENLNITRVRDCAAADKVILSNAFIKSIYKSEWSIRKFDKAVLLDYVMNGKLEEYIKNHSSGNIQQIDAAYKKKIQEKLDLIPDLPIVINYWEMSDFLGLNNYIRSSELLEEIAHESLHTREYIEESDYNLLSVFIADKSKLVAEKTALDLASSNVTMTAEQYTNIHRMLNSNNLEDRELAVITMSNLDMNSSYSFLMLLFMDNDYNIKHTKAWNHASSKAIKNEFHRMRIDHSSIIQNSHKLGGLSKEVIDIITERQNNSLISSHRHVMEVFDIPVLKIKDKYLV